jgi:S1-C subfamily serine protease
MRRANSALALLAVAVLGLAATGCGGGSATVTTVTPVTTVTQTAPAATAPATARDESTAEVVARVLRGVVNVRTVGFDGNKSEASGVVIDPGGIILTNDHVVQGARTLTVYFNDGRHRTPVRATVIGTAVQHDLAVIRVPLGNLIPVPLGRSATLRLGDSVLAIGFPLGLSGGPTVTQGIISGLNRSIHAGGGPQLAGLLQTDAAINPGNSGGALVDSTGRLVGINTIAATSAQNIGFAIAIDGARAVIDEIRHKPGDRQPWIGVTFASIGNAAAAVQLGLPPGTRGAGAIAVFAGSPASKAGLHEGDVVVAVDGRAVHSAADMAKALAARRIGASIVLDVVDTSGPRRVTLQAVERPATLTGG